MHLEYTVEYKMIIIKSSDQYYGNEHACNFYAIYFLLSKLLTEIPNAWH